MKKFLIMAVFTVAVMVPVAAFPGTEIDRIVAVVGDNIITLSELQTEMAPALAELNQRLRGDELARAEDRLKKSTVNSLVDKYLQLQEAKVEGVETDEGEIDRAVADIMNRNNMDKPAFEAALRSEGYTLEDYRKSLGEQLAILKVVSRAVKSRVIIHEEEIAKEYGDNIAKYSTPESITVANILFPAKDGDMDTALKNAQAAKAEIQEGKPFEEMAAKCTGDPNAAKSCVLGTFGRGDLASDIEGKAFNMAAGEVSEPVRTDKGYELLKVTEHVQKSIKPLADVRTRIVDEITQKKSETLFANWIEELRKHTYVEIRE